MRPVILVALFGSLLSVSCKSTTIMTTLYAQSLPSTRTVAWDPRPAAENVVAYKVQLDSGTVQRVPLTACTGTPVVCSAQFSVATFGVHTIFVMATNLAISTVPTSEQDSAPASLAFALNQSAGAVSGIGVR